MGFERLIREFLFGRPKAAAAFSDAHLQLHLASEMARLQRELRESMPDNPAAHGFKVYSQCDEDGIIETICHRLRLEAGVFVEIGCGSGFENNTHYLLLKGWSGVWVDGDSSNTAVIRRTLPDVPSLLCVAECQVTKENVVSLLQQQLGTLGKTHSVDLLSVDIDGNDLPVALAAAAATSPKVLVVEYNAKFPYPMSQCVKYDPAHTWKNDDYHGASLGAWVQALDARYRLVCCNLAGTNAFFVRGDLASEFPLRHAAELYQPARFYLTALRAGHPASLSFLSNHLRSHAGNPVREPSK